MRELQTRISGIDAKTKCVDATSLAGAPYLKVTFTGAGCLNAITKVLDHGHFRAAGQEFPLEEKRVKAGRKPGDASSEDGEDTASNRDGDISVNIVTVAPLAPTFGMSAFSASSASSALMGSSASSGLSLASMPASQDQTPSGGAEMDLVAEIRGDLAKAVGILDKTGSKVDALAREIARLKANQRPAIGGGLFGASATPPRAGTSLSGASATPPQTGASASSPMKTT